MGKILLLDSDKSFMKSLELFLREEFLLKSTFHPNLAISMIKKENFDFLLMDINFRSSQIVPFIKRVREIQPDIFIILMYTVFNDQEELESEVQNLADEVLYKPFDPDNLFHILNKKVSL